MDVGHLPGTFATPVRVALIDHGVSHIAGDPGELFSVRRSNEPNQILIVSSDINTDKFDLGKCFHPIVTVVTALLHT